MRTTPVSPSHSLPFPLSSVTDTLCNAGTYGITTSGNSLSLKFVTQGPYSTNIGSRVYLLSEDDTTYEMFNLKNQEFTFDVDMSKLPCGLNGALYFVEMDKDGGSGRFPSNKAGSKYGTGYCDTQCPHDIKFINGEVRSSPCRSGLLVLTQHRHDRRTSSAGRARRATRTRARASTARAATRWTSGRPTHRAQR